MGYHPRIESRDHASFVTTRTRNSELWFANNDQVESFTLGLLAKLTDRYRVILYAFALEGSHYHKVGDFPLENRADFERDFNSGIARAVARLTSHYRGGRLWARRYSSEMIAGPEDIEEWFFYTVLQPVQDGLVDRISDYPGYNCFNDAVCGIERKFKVVNWASYNEARRYNSKVSIRDFTEVHTLRYQRLPGYEDLSQEEYKKLMRKKLEMRRLEILENRRAAGKKGCVGKHRLLKTIPGTPAKNPKISTIKSHRPRVLSTSDERRAEVRAWYFDVHFEYKECSKRFRAGEVDVIFPHGTYYPPTWMVERPGGPHSVI